MKRKPSVCHSTFRNIFEFLLPYTGARTGPVDCAPPSQFIHSESICRTLSIAVDCWIVRVGRWLSGFEVRRRTRMFEDTGFVPCEEFCRGMPRLWKGFIVYGLATRS